MFEKLFVNFVCLCVKNVLHLQCHLFRYVKRADGKRVCRRHGEGGCMCINF